SFFAFHAGCDGLLEEGIDSGNKAACNGDAGSEIQKPHGPAGDHRAGGPEWQHVAQELHSSGDAEKSDGNKREDAGSFADFDEGMRGNALKGLQIAPHINQQGRGGENYAALKAATGRELPVRDDV